MASSNATASGNANDGNTATSWQAETSDTTPWWSVDLELSYTITSVALTFPGAVNYRYTIDVSTDGTTWTTVDDESKTTSTSTTHTATGAFGSDIEFVRVSFVGQPAALAEVVVGGD
jgi:alpha-L-fucosidase